MSSNSKTMLSLQLFSLSCCGLLKELLQITNNLQKATQQSKRTKKKYKQYKKGRHSDAKQEDPKIIRGTRNISCGKPRWPIFQLELFASSGFRQSFKRCPKCSQARNFGRSILTLREEALLSEYI